MHDTLSDAEEDEQLDEAMKSIMREAGHVDKKMLDREQGEAKWQRLDPMTSKSAPRFREKPSSSQRVPRNNENADISYLELQEANNIYKAAYKELMILALQEKTWIEFLPALGSLEELIQMFRTPPRQGMVVESSVASSVIPMKMEDLVVLMTDIDKWEKWLSNIVRRVDTRTPIDILKQLTTTDSAIKHMCSMHVEFQLPTTFLKTRRLKFLRCVREITPDMYAVVDLSDDYFPHRSNFPSGQNCRRRPSGLIVRRHGIFSEVIWIENMEVHCYPSEDNIYSGMIESKTAFSAQRWLNTLRWSLMKSYSSFINVKMGMHQQTARTALQDLAHFLKFFYIDVIDETPDRAKWVIISEEGGVRILRNLLLNAADKSLNNYIVVTSFRVQAKPRSVFRFLIKKNMELKWPGDDMGEPEEVIRFASYDNSYVVTLHKNTVLRYTTGGNKSTEFLLQETSMDGCCSFVVSAPMDQLDVNGAFVFANWEDPLMMPSGFAILPDGSDAFSSDSSLVTLVMQQASHSPETEESIDFITDMIGIIIEEILDEIGGENEGTSETSN